MIDLSGSIVAWPQDLTQEERILLEDLERGNIDKDLVGKICDFLMSNCSESFRKIIAMRIWFHCWIYKSLEKNSKGSVVCEVETEEFFTKVTG